MPLVDEILVCFGWCLVGLKSLWDAAVKKKLLWPAVKRLKFIWLN